MYDYYYLRECLPGRRSADIQQEQDREIVYAFGNGELSESIKKSFLGKIKEITGNSKSEWVVCFIPGSTGHRASIRFSKLADAIQKEGYSVEQKAIFNRYDRGAGYLTGRTGNPIESFGFGGTGIVNKNILLIDDAITRGITFSLTADKLKSFDAKNVTGLFLAHAINPDYGSCYEEPYNEEPDYGPYEGETYKRYNSSHTQDVKGWDGQDIDDVFDGDPDAYWNID